VCGHGLAKETLCVEKKQLQKSGMNCRKHNEWAHYLKLISSPVLATDASVHWFVIYGSYCMNSYFVRDSCYETDYSDSEVHVIKYLSTPKYYDRKFEARKSAFPSVGGALAIG
jgi:hypothetical protein